MNNFRKTITFQETRECIYEALTSSIPKWWTEMFEGISNDEGQSFTIRFGANVFKTMKVEELIPNTKVVWYVTDSLIGIPELKNKTEWINTKIIWEISTLEDRPELQLTHFGLTPQIECYSICEVGWQNFTDSLTSFIETGIGKPFKI